MAPGERLRQLPSSLAFKSGVMFCIGLPLGRAVGAGAFTDSAIGLAAVGAAAALLGVTWQALRARQEIKA